MSKYICKKCGSDFIYLKNKGPHNGIYCKNCDAWIAWIKHGAESKDIELKKQLNNTNSNSSKIDSSFVDRQLANLSNKQVTAPVQYNNYNNYDNVNYNISEAEIAAYMQGMPDNYENMSSVLPEVIIEVHGAATIHRANNVPEYIYESSRLVVCGNHIKVFDIATDVFVKEFDV